MRAPGQTKLGFFPLPPAETRQLSWRPGANDTSGFRHCIWRSLNFTDHWKEEEEDGTGIFPNSLRRHADRRRCVGRLFIITMLASILAPVVLGFVIPFWGVLLAPPLLAVVYAYKKWRTAQGSGS